MLGNIGWFNKQKNHKFLIDVFYQYHKINNNSYLVLIGTGKLYNRIKRKVNDLNISDNVLFLDNINNVNKVIKFFWYSTFPIYIWMILSFNDRNTSKWIIHIN